MYCSATRSCTASWPAGQLDGFGNAADAGGRRGGDRRDRRGLPFRFVDLLRLAGFRLLDHFLLHAFGGVDGGVARAFGGQNHRALLAFGAHLLFHRGENVGGRRDVLDLVAQHLHAPRLGRLVELADDLRVDVGALLERSVQIDLADFASQRRLCKLGNGEQIVRDAVGRPLRIQHLEIQHAIDANLHVVARNADLRRNVEGDLLQRVAVADDVDERQQHVKAGVQDAVKPSEPLDDVRALLRNDDGRLRNDDEHEDREDQQREKTTGHERSLSGLRKIIRRSTSTTLHRSPRAIVAVS